MKYVTLHIIFFSLCLVDIIFLPSLPSLCFSSLFAPPPLMYVHSPGLLSSFGELEYACTPPSSSSSSNSSIGTVDQHLDLPCSPVLLPWNPDRAANTTYPITTYQPTYFVADRCHPIPFHRNVISAAADAFLSFLYPSLNNCYRNSFLFEIVSTMLPTH